MLGSSGDVGLQKVQGKAGSVGCKTSTRCTGKGKERVLRFLAAAACGACSLHERKSVGLRSSFIGGSRSFVKGEADLLTRWCGAQNNLEFLCDFSALRLLHQKRTDSVVRHSRRTDGKSSAFHSEQTQAQTPHSNLRPQIVSLCYSPSLPRGRHIYGSHPTSVFFLHHQTPSDTYFLICTNPVQLNRNIAQNGKQALHHPPPSTLLPQPSRFKARTGTTMLLPRANMRLISTAAISSTSTAPPLAANTPRSILNAQRQTPRFNAKPNAMMPSPLGTQRNLVTSSILRNAAAAAQKAISKGDQIPNTTFVYVPFTPELADGAACGAPTKIQTHEAFKGKKVVIVAVPGAYTRKLPFSFTHISLTFFLCSDSLTLFVISIYDFGFIRCFSTRVATCHVNHIPPYVKQVDAFKSKGVDQIIVLAQNDPFVMSAWGVQNKAEDKVIFATDLNLEFSKGLDATADLSAHGFGQRTEGTPSS